LEALRQELDRAALELDRVTREIADMRQEVRRLEADARAQNKAAYEIQDRARLAVSLAMAFIHDLRTKMTGAGVHAPEVPDDLAIYAQAIMWTDALPTGGRTCRVGRDPPTP
jgi:hypothetical protein